MDLITVRTCPLDPVGIPDLADLTATTIDLDQALRADLSVAVDDVDPERHLHYPFATVDTPARRHVIPLEPTTALDDALAALELLRAALAPTPITGIPSITTITGNAGNAGIDSNASIDNNAGIVGNAAKASNTRKTRIACNTGNAGITD